MTLKMIATERGPKVATEVAEAEFARFLEAMDLEINTATLDQEDRTSFDEAKRRVVRAIEGGSLVIDERGQPVFTAHDGTEITFHEPTGASFMAMDGKKKDANVAKMIAVLADMTKQPPTVFSKMPNRDFKICQTLVTLFLG